MANQGCPGEGTDHRHFGWLICGLQRALSFHSDTEPFGIMLAFPPFIAINIPLFVGGYYLMMRVGWRYDKNWKGYIFPEAALKIMKSTVYY